MKNKNHLILICGPTGIGKTSLAIQLAFELQCEIISCDSRQFYKEMRIGTAIPSSEELSKVKHYFIHSQSVNDKYNASSFERDVMLFLSTYFNGKKLVLMVGGSGMYIDALVNGIDDLPTIMSEVREKWQAVYEEKGLEYLQNYVREIDPLYYAKVDCKNYKRLLKAVEVYEQSGKPYSRFLNN